MISKIDILKAIAKSEFRPFGEKDWDAYSGCRSVEPLIAELDQFLIIVDGDEVYVEEYETGDHHIFSLEELEDY